MKTARLMVICSVLFGCTSKKAVEDTSPSIESPIPDLAAVTAQAVNPIYFAYDIHEFSGSMVDVMVANLDSLKKSAPHPIALEGHADDRGSNEYNLALGFRRANSVKNFLVAGGIPESRITVKSFGEEQPKDPRRVKEAWSQNRRVDIFVGK